MFDPQDIIYLTPDSSNGGWTAMALLSNTTGLILVINFTDLEEIDSSKVLIIGGLVDRSPNKVIQIQATFQSMLCYC